MPVPAVCAACRPRQNLSKMCGSSSDGMPTPVSVTVSSAFAPTGRTVIATGSASGLDDAVVATATVAAAQAARVPALARTLSAARGGWQVDLGDGAEQARAAQRSAMAAHSSQSDALADLMFRVRLLGRGEWLRWLVPPLMGP
jgi:hypothetical protein